MSRVDSVHLRRIYDSRGAETVEATVGLVGGGRASAGAPNSASTGAHEVTAWPAGGVAEVLAGPGGAAARELRAAGEVDQAAFDAVLHRVDGTPNFSRLGGNTATALSVAFALAEAAASGRPLAERIRRPGLGATVPAIVGNSLNGGRHAIGGPEIQEFIAFAEDPDPARSVPAALAAHRELGRLLHQKLPKQALGRGDEGGWVAPLGNLESLELLASACATAADATGVRVSPGLDLAASEFYRDGRYVYREQTLDGEGQVAFLSALVDKYGLRYLEDPFDQEAFDDFARLTKAVGDRVLVVGDDLYTTNATRLARGIERGSTNAVLIKVNQVGTITDALATVDLARSRGLATVASHRSGDLPEGWLAQFAVGTGAAGIKCGLLGGERVAKLNELLRVAAPPGTPR